ncbi:unnamed protein product [Symbiodinium sp. CCMP2456]|nr:unnamed protein product [Symbiodinium sp. CCMP2456]
MAPWWLPAFGLLFVAAGLWLLCRLACCDEEEDSTEEEVEEDEEEQYDDKMSSRTDDSRPSRDSSAYWEEGRPGDAREDRGWLLLVSGFVLTWLLAVLVALPVTAKLLALAAPGCLLGLLVARDVGKGGDKWILVPTALLWFWLAVVPFLDDGLLWKWLLLLPGLLSVAAGAHLLLRRVDASYSLLSHMDPDEGEPWRECGWLLLVMGVVTMWLSVLPILLPVTAQLLFGAIPGSCWGFWMALYLRKVSDKRVLLPATLLWLWLSALPSLGNLAWWRLALQLPGLGLCAVGVAMAAQEPRAEGDVHVGESDEEARERKAKARKVAGKSLAWSWGGLWVSWLLSTGSLLPISWPLAVAALPGLAFGLFLVGVVAIQGAPPDGLFCILHAGFAWLGSLPVLVAAGSWCLFLFLELFGFTTCAAHEQGY